MKKNKKNVMNKLMKEVKNKFRPVETGKQTLDQVTKKEPIKSNTDVNSLEEFVQLTQLSQKKFEILNEQVVVQNINSDNKNYGQNQYSNIMMGNILKNSDISVSKVKALPIPRRPKYVEKTEVKEFERLEREAFLNWRRALAMEEEQNIHFAITPFEKNIEIWRQLWMVVDKADLLVQIVDGRNPLYYRCDDLESYVKEINPKKETVLLINKADLMSIPIRKHWADYLKEKNINYVFFSAKKEAEKIAEKDKYNMIDLKEDEDVEGGKVDEINEDEDDQDEDDDEEVIVNKNKFDLLNMINNDNDDTEVNEEKFEKKIENIVKTNEQVTEEVIKVEKKNEKTNENTDNKENKNKTEENKEEINIEEEVKTDDDSLRDDLLIMNREQLLKYLKNKVSSIETKIAYNIGFVGFPNVGKSSVINVVMNEKKVAVASMPGKTKHYQTLFLNNDRTFCLIDCPGLVFPSFTKSKADMVCNGILNIDTIVDYHSPIALVIQNVPRENLMHYYKIILPEIYSASQFLKVAATKRGFVTGSSTPDEARIAKIILKEYVSGHLLFNHLRPDYNPELHGVVYNYEIFNGEQILDNVEYRQNIETLKQIPALFDDNFDKLGGEFEGRDKVDNFDVGFFADSNAISMKDRKITKEIKRMLKFAVKRGEITDEEVESLETFEDMEILLKAVQKKNKEENTLNKDLVNIRAAVVDK